MPGIDHPVVGLFLALAVGFVLGLLGGGGSILALPIFLYVFHVPVKPAIAMSLAVVGMSAFVGFLSHWRQGTVSLKVAVPFGVCAMAGAFVTARVAYLVPAEVQLALFAVFAVTASLLMLRDARRSQAPLGDADGVAGGGGSDGGGEAAGAAGGARRGAGAGDGASTTTEAEFRWPLAVQALGVGALTALIGAGGGFVIVPALVLLAKVPVRRAVGSSLLIITMNALSGFVGYIGQVRTDWPLVAWFTSVAAVGAMTGTRLVPHVPQARIKQGFAVMILVLGSYFALRKLHLLP